MIRPKFGRRSALIATATLSSVALVTAMALTPLALAGARQADVPAAAPADLAPDMVAELARTFDITPSEAIARLGREATFARTERSLRATIGAGFGGAYLDADATTLTVAVTSSRQFARVRAAGATPKLVTRSESQLVSIVGQLDQRAAQAPRTTPAWYPDVHNNTVTVLYRAGGLDAAKAWVTAGKVDTSTVRYEISAENPKPLIDVIGGNAYYIGSGTRCSIGFSVVGGFVTAGHCGNTGASTSQPSGSFRGSSFPGNDYAWVQVASGNTPRALVNRYPGTVTVNGSQQTSVGASVCRSGSTTGWHCGTVQQFNASVTYPQGTVNGLIRTTVCAEPGDSGGSLLAGDQAQGVTSGGSGNCSSGGTTYFQPVNEILQVYGLTLVVGSGPPPTTPPPTTPPPSPTPSPTGTSPPPGCGGLPGWSSSSSYVPGDRVSHNGHRWESTWWSTGAEPGAPASWAVWRDEGSC